MRYFHFKLYTPFAGTDQEGVEAFEDGTTDSEVEECFSDMCHDNAESFSYMIDSDLDEAEDEEEREAIEDDYYAGCDFEYWETDEDDFINWQP